MSAPLLYEMFKSKSGFPLHLAVRHHREDVVFLFLIEFNSQVEQKHLLGYMSSINLVRNKRNHGTTECV